MLIAAFALGYGLNTRYLTAAALALPFLIYETVMLIFRRQRWSWSHAGFLTISVSMVVPILVHNYLISGNLFEAPNHFYHAWERLWFHKDYTPLNALQFVMARLFLLIDWIPPIFIALYFADFFRKPSGGAQQMLFRLGFFYPVIAYIFYYSWGGNQYGPRYYFEGLPFLMLAAGAWIENIWQHGDQNQQKFLIGILIVATAGNFYLLFKQGTYYEKVSSERKGLYVLAEKTAQKPALVFIRGFLGDTLVMSEEDAVRNRPDLESGILYAHDLGEKNKRLMQYYPNRNGYLGTYNRVSKEAVLEPLRN